jgi:glycosyltransferase involved in cell wall biosynthesis
MQGTVSICIPAYRARFLEAAIESVLAQTRPVRELIIVDDFSPEDLGSVVASFQGSGIKGLRYVQNSRNVGVPENYNLTLSMASSDYVMILGDHDVLCETFVEYCAGLLDTDPDINLVFSSIAEIDEEGQTVREQSWSQFPTVFPGQTLARYLVTRRAAPLTMDTLIRRSSLIGCEPWFDPKYWWYGDIHLWIRLAAKGKVGYVREPVLRRRRREAGHHLNGKEWRSLLTCDRIRRDDWSLAFPKGGLESWLARTVYYYHKDTAGLLLLGSKLARSDLTRAEALPREALSLFSPIGRILALTLAALPRSTVRVMKRLYAFVWYSLHLTSAL